MDLGKEDSVSSRKTPLISAWSTKTGSGRGVMAGLGQAYP